MGDRVKKNLKLLCFIVFAVLIISGCKIKEKDNNISNSNAVSNQSNDEIKSFLTSGKLVSKSSAVGSGFPDGFYFSYNNKFAYYKGDVEPTLEGEQISYRGTWHLDGSKLVLSIEKEEVVVGGSKSNINGDIVLTNYEKKIQKVTKKSIYNIAKLYKEDNCIELSNGDKLYNISPETNYLNILSTLANDGYDAYLKELGKFEQE